jgi:hypothetical protein
MYMYKQAKRLASLYLSTVHQYQGTCNGLHCRTVG